MCLMLFRDDLVAQFGLHIEVNLLTEQSLILIGAILLASIIVAVIPSLSGFRKAKSSLN